MKMKKYQVFLLIALMFATVFVFYPVLSADYVNLDDIGVVKENPKVHSLTADNIKSMFFEPLYKLYHPFVNLSYAVEYRLFGADPYFYHADNLILHLLNTLLVFFIFWRLTKNSFAISFITALIFACHPMHVEPVAWITGRKDTLYAFFFLSSWLTYLKAYDCKDKKRILMISASLALFLCACLSKSMAVTLPVILILCDWLTDKKFNKKSVIKYIPFLAAAAVFSFITYLLYYTPGQKSDLTLYTLSVNFAAAHFNALFYTAKFLFPVKLSILYPFFYDAGANPPDFILYSPALVYGIIVLILYSLRKTKKIAFGFAFFIVTILPVINILPTGIAPVADRYTYIPFIGFGYIAAVAAAYLYRKIKKRNLKLLFVSAVSAIMVIMCFTAHAKAGKWHDTKTLFDDAIRNYPGGVSKAYSTRASSHTGKDWQKNRERDLEMALYLDPANNEAAYALAAVRLAQKKYNEAIRLYAILSYDDYNIEGAYMYTAKIYYDKNHKEEAYKIINDGIKRFPKTFYLYDTLGVFYAYDKEYAKAAETFKKSKELNPAHLETYVYLAQIYEILGQPDLAEKEYKEGIANCPHNRDLLFGLGKFYIFIGDSSKAYIQFMHAVKKYPSDYESYAFLGSIESSMKNYKKALYYNTLAVLLKNDYAEAYFNRAEAHFETGNYLKSAEDAKKAGSLGFDISSAYIKKLKDKSGIII